MRNLPVMNYAADFPEALKDSVSRAFSRALAITPLWLQTIEISYSQDDSCCMEIEVNMDYRHANLTIFAPFCVHTPAQQKEAAVHEIIHCFNVPLKSVAIDAMESVAEDKLDPRIMNLWRDRINETMEMLTQDFSFVISKVLYEEGEK